MLGIIGSMDVEIDALKKMVENANTVTVSGIEYVSGQLFDKDVVVAKCGVGKVFASVCAQTMILNYHPDAMINTGVGGSMRDGISILDVVIGSNAVQHDMDTSAVGDPVGMISGINTIYLPCDAEISDQIRNCADKIGVKAHIGTVASGDVFVSDGALKKKIRFAFDASVCEMEGAAIAQVCYINGVKLAIVRTVSDGGADGGGMDYLTFKHKAAAQSIRVVTE